jgi:predicted O-methyltransferase YrrM
MHAKIARANVAHAGLADRVDIRLGKALDSLPTLASEGPFDFIYIDADQENSANYFQWAVKLSRRGSLIVTDNVIRHGSIIDGENCKPAVQGLRRFYGLVAAEPKVSMTALQTVGSNGHDGFAIAVVTANQ